jgi:hypothetical protein
MEGTDWTLLERRWWDVFWVVHTVVKDCPRSGFRIDQEPDRWEGRFEKVSC